MFRSDGAVAEIEREVVVERMGMAPSALSHDRPVIADGPNSAWALADVELASGARHVCGVHMVETGGILRITGLLVVHGARTIDMLCATERQRAGIRARDAIPFRLRLVETPGLDLSNLEDGTPLDEGGWSRPIEQSDVERH